MATLWGHQLIERCVWWRNYITHVQIIENKYRDLQSAFNNGAGCVCKWMILHFDESAKHPNLLHWYLFVLLQEIVS